MITSKIKRRIKRELDAKKPTVLIGKNGISNEVLAEIDGQLERTEMMKVKILKTALKRNNTRSIVNRIAEQTESILVGVKGHTFLLYRKKEKKV